jgi:hypothetical protein
MLITALVLIITESVWREGASTPTRFASRPRCGVRRDARDRATYSWMLDLIYGRSRGRRSRYDRFAGLRLIVLGEPSRDLPLLPTDLATHLIIIQSGIIIKHTVDIVADHLCRDETAHFFSYLRFVEKNVVGKIRKREIAGHTRPFSFFREKKVFLDYALRISTCRSDFLLLLFHSLQPPQSTTVKCFFSCPPCGNYCSSLS